MPFTPNDLGTCLGPEVRSLVEQISKVKRAVKDIEEAYQLDSLESKLKKILHEMVAPDEKGHHTVIVDGVKAKVFMRKGREKIDREAALRLLHPNTFRAIFSEGQSYPVLEVEPARVSPLAELFAILDGTKHA